MLRWQNKILPAMHDHKLCTATSSDKQQKRMTHWKIHLLSATQPQCTRPTWFNTFTKLISQAAIERYCWRKAVHELSDKAGLEHIADQTDDGPWSSRRYLQIIMNMSMGSQPDSVLPHALVYSPLEYRRRKPYSWSEKRSCWSCCTAGWRHTERSWGKQKIAVLLENAIMSQPVGRQ